jgi:hypothetical protein
MQTFWLTNRGSAANPRVTASRAEQDVNSKVCVEKAKRETWLKSTERFNRLGTRASVKSQERLDLSARESSPAHHDGVATDVWLARRESVGIHHGSHHKGHRRVSMGNRPSHGTRRPDIRRGCFASTGRNEDYREGCRPQVGSHDFSPANDFGVQLRAPRERRPLEHSTDRHARRPSAATASWAANLRLFGAVRPLQAAPLETFRLNDSTRDRSTEVPRFIGPGLRCLQEEEDTLIIPVTALS